jgi:hypothetical protein
VLLAPTVALRSEALQKIRERLATVVNLKRSELDPRGRRRYRGGGWPALHDLTAAQQRQRKSC